MEDEDYDDEDEGDMMENVETETNTRTTVDGNQDELDGILEKRAFVEESEYDLEVNKDSLTEYETKMLGLMKEVIMTEVSERKIRRMRTSKKGLLQCIDKAAESMDSQ